MPSLAGPQITGVHLVGSVPLSSTEDVLRSAFQALPNRVKRVPDGETGERYFFTDWFRANPIFERQPILRHEVFDPEAQTAFSDAEMDEIFDRAGKLETGYDKAALESYEVFKKLRAEGVVPRGVRFMVALPSPVVLASQYFRGAFLSRAGPLVEAHMSEVVERIQLAIPAADLAIQWDVPIEFALLEGVEWVVMPGHVMRVWFEPLFEGLIDRMAAIGESVHAGVEVGYHFCYGDVARTHFVQPNDAGLMATVGEALLRKINRHVDWIHLPVPKNRTDRRYYEPLRKFAAAAAESSTEIILGVVHEHDLEGTRERIRVAGEVLDRFGIGTECGLGRADKEVQESVWEISKMLSTPVSRWPTHI